MPLTHIAITLVVSAFTGWLVVWVIIKLLFRPLKPVTLAGFTIQGIVPASQQSMAEKIGKLVSTELFSFSALEEKITDPENFNKLKPEIETHIDGFLRDRLKDSFPMLSMLIGSKTINQLKGAFLLELETLFPVLMKSYLGRLEKELNLETMVRDKIASISIARAEELVYRSAKKQLFQIQLLGAGIGFVTGFIHVLINTQVYS